MPSRRAKVPPTPRPQPHGNSEPLRVLVDSTGLCLCGASE